MLCLARCLNRLVECTDTVAHGFLATPQLTRRKVERSVNRAVDGASLEASI
jgi:hypothetical protein